MSLFYVFRVGNLWTETTLLLLHLHIDIHDRFQPSNSIQSSHPYPFVVVFHLCAVSLIFQQQRHNLRPHWHIVIHLQQICHLCLGITMRAGKPNSFCEWVVGANYRRRKKSPTQEAQRTVASLYWETDDETETDTISLSIPRRRRVSKVAETRKQKQVRFAPATVNGAAEKLVKVSHDAGIGCSHSN